MAEGGLFVGEVTTTRQTVTGRGGLLHDSRALWISEGCYKPLEDLKMGVIHLGNLRTDRYGLIRSAC